MASRMRSLTLWVGVSVIGLVGLLVVRAGCSVALKVGKVIWVIRAIRAIRAIGRGDREHVRQIYHIIL